MSQSIAQTSERAWQCIQRGHLGKAWELLNAPVKQLKDTEFERGGADLLSLFGYTIALLLKKREEGIQMCKRAISMDSLNSRHFYLLGRIYLDVNARTKARDIWLDGQRIDPNNALIYNALQEVERRAKPVFPFLRRSHPLNKALGRIRHRMKKKGSGS